MLRGPQGTRYGANALGGLIKVKTRDPKRVIPNSTPKLPSAATDCGPRARSRAAASAAARSSRAPGARCCSARRATASATTASSAATTPTAATRRRRGCNPARRRRRAGRPISRCCTRTSTTATTPLRSTTASHTLSDRPGRDAQRSDGASSTIALDARARWRTALDHDLGRLGHRRELRRRLGQRRATGARRALRLLLETRRGRRDAQPGPAPLGRDRRRGLRGSRALWLSRLEEDNHITDDGRYLEDAFVRRTRQPLPRDQRRALRAARLALRRATRRSPRACASRSATRDYADSDGVAFDPRERCGAASCASRIA